MGQPGPRLGLDGCELGLAGHRWTEIGAGWGWGWTGLMLNPGLSSCPTGIGFRKFPGASIGFPMHTPAPECQQSFSKCLFEKATYIFHNLMSASNMDCKGEP